VNLQNGRQERPGRVVIATDHARGNFGTHRQQYEVKKSATALCVMLAGFHAGKPTRHRKKTMYTGNYGKVAPRHMRENDGSDQTVRKSIRPPAVQLAISRQWTLVSNWADVTWNLCY